MKKALVIAALTVMSTGCSTVGNAVHRAYIAPVSELAVEDCKKMGFRPGTPAFEQCALATATSIRSARAARAAASEQVRERVRPRTVTCHRTGSIVQCSEF